MRVVGCDPSLSGFAASEVADTLLLMHEWKSKPLGDSVRMRMKRFNNLVLQVCEWIEQRYSSEQLVVYVEGYSFGSKGGMAWDRAELRGVLYSRLVARVGATIVEVSPATVKMFASDKGSADKAAVVSALTKRYGVCFGSDNQADAFALMKLGLCVEGLEEPQTQSQRRAVDTVRKLRQAA